MNYQRRRRLYSQNFLRSPELVNKLIRNSSLGKNDIVLEIGSGTGLITSELIKTAGKVISVELDSILYKDLARKFACGRNLELHNVNFLNFSLPRTPFKVFANIPFVITSEIIKKLTENQSFQEGYLIVQKEAAQRFVGKPYDYKNQMVSVLLKPWFDLTISWRFKKSDFIPQPNVDTMMIRINRVSKSPVPYSEKENYRDFILYAYNKYKGISYYDFPKVVKVFEEYVHRSANFQSSVRQMAKKIRSAQKNLPKIHRTRKAKNWRRLRPKGKELPPW